MVRNLNDSPLERMVDAQQHARRENPFESASVRDGQVRFIGGRLLIDAGGTLQVIGRFDGNGSFEWSGSWKFDSGDGEIAGDVRLTGDFELLGRLLAGGVRIEDGKVHVGGMVLDPAEHGGAVIFPNGAQVFTDGDTIQVFLGNSVVQVSEDYARLQHGGNVLQLDGDGVRVSPGAVGAAASGETVSPLGINGSGRLRRIPTTGGTP